MACCLGASVETVDAIYRAHPDAIGRVDARMGYTPLHWACRFKQSSAVLRHLAGEYPAALAEAGRYGCQTPLRVACLYGASPSSIAALASAYPDAARTRDRDGRTALHLACECGGSANADVVQVLIEACPEANWWADRRGRTPLHAAFEFGAPADVCGVLISTATGAGAAADPSLLGAPDHAGNTPLHKACGARASLEILRSMLEADPSLAARTNRAGEVPLCLLWEAMTEREMHAAIRGVPVGDFRGEDPTTEDEVRRETEEFRREASALRARIRLLLRASHHGTVSDTLPLTDEGVERKFRMLHAACGVRCPRLLLDLVLERHRGEAAERDEEGNTALGLAVKSMGRLRRDVAIASRHQQEDRLRGRSASFSSCSTLSSISSCRSSTLATAVKSKGKVLIPDEATSRMLYAKNVASSLLSLHPRSAYSRDPSDGRYPLHVALHGGMTWHDGAVAELVRAGPEVVTVRDARTRMYAHEMAAAYVRDRGDTVLELLSIYPHVLKNRLDLMEEMRKNDRDKTEEEHDQEEEQDGKEEDNNDEVLGLDLEHCNVF